MMGGIGQWPVHICPPCPTCSTPKCPVCGEPHQGSTVRSDGSAQYAHSGTDYCIERKRK